jgi:phage gp36-like protein
VSQYLGIYQFRQLLLPEAALRNVPSPVIVQHIVKASAKVDSYIRGAATLPLVGAIDEAAGTNTFPDEVQAATAAIARYKFLLWRGMRPDQFDQLVVDEYHDELSWLKDVSAGRANLAASADQTLGYDPRPRVSSDTVQGWYDRFTTTERDR